MGDTIVRDSLHDLLEQTIRRYVHRAAYVITVTTQPMAQNEQGYSGAAMARHVVAFTTPAGETQHVQLITKEASLRERRVLALLVSQRQDVPFCHTLDLTTDEPVLMCQQDLSTNPPQPLADADRQAARCLARIHAVNLGRGGDLPWLPRADRAYLEGTILADYRTQLALAQASPAFSSEYGLIAQQVEQTVPSFLTDMDALWQEGDALTVIHADVMDSHLLFSGGHPSIIDWGQARYGPLYLDLPNYFTPATVLFYREALAEFGVPIPTDKFMERYQKAGRYPGFKYIGVLLYLWTNGHLDSLHGPLLQQLLHGGAAS